MGFLVIFAQKESRLYNSRIAIAFAGAGMLLQNPFLLRYDLGFLLSFLATIGLLTLYPRLEESAHRWPKLGGMKEAFLQTISAQAWVLPVLVVAFGTIPLISPLANVLVLPFIPAAMFFSFVAGISGIFFPALGVFIAFPAQAILSYEIGVTKILSRVPYASIPVYNLWFTLLGIIVLAGVFMFVRELIKEKTRKDYP